MLRDSPDRCAPRTWPDEGEGRDRIGGLVTPIDLFAGSCSADEHRVYSVEPVWEPSGMSPSRFVAVVLVFVLVGPPLGAVTVGLAGGLAALVLGDDSGMAGLVFYAALLGLPLSWFFGGVQAAVAGLAFAAFAAIAPRPSIAVGIAAGLVAGLPYGLGEDLSGAELGVVLLAHGVAAAICGVIGQSMLRSAASVRD